MGAGYGKGKHMKKTKRELTEERILEAALNLFSEKGYAGASTSEIAKEANVAEGTIFRYFPQKKDMLLKVVMRFIDIISDQIVMSPLEKIYEENQGASPEVMLKKIIMDRVALFNKLGDHFKVILIEMQYHEEIMEVFIDKVLVRVIRYGEKVYGDFINRGICRDDIPALTAFRTMVGGVVLMMVQRRVLPGAIPDGLALEAEIDMIIDILMNGIKKRGAVQ